MGGEGLACLLAPESSKRVTKDRKIEEREGDGGDRKKRTLLGYRRAKGFV
jgi:hypothetical protein